jgi:hypothetical protein
MDKGLESGFTVRSTVVGDGSGSGTGRARINHCYSAGAFELSYA